MSKWIDQTEGNIISDGIEITVDFLEDCLENDIRISLRTGNFWKGEKPRKRERGWKMELVNAVHDLYISGDFYVYRFCKIFGFRKPQRMIEECFRPLGLRILSSKEYRSLYSEDIKKSTLQTNLEKYGTKSPLQNKEIEEKTRKTCLLKYGTPSVHEAANSPEASIKREQTNLEKYGVSHTFQSTEMKEKSKETNLERYGVDNPMKSREIQSCVRKTMLERYGVDHNWRVGELRDKLESKWIERYGFNNPSKSEEVKQRIITSNLAKYGVTATSKRPEIKAAVKMRNLTKYGVESTFNLPSLNPTLPYDDEFSIKRTQEKLRMVSGWKSGEVSEDQITFFAKANFTPDFARKWLKSIGIESSDKFSIDEIRMMDILNQMNVKFDPMVKFEWMDRKELDFFLPDFNVAIEVNGDWFHSEEFYSSRGMEVDKGYHLSKILKCHENGVKLIMFTGSEIFKAREKIEEILRHHLFGEELSWEPLPEERVRYSMFDKSFTLSVNNLTPFPVKVGKYIHWYPVFQPISQGI